MSVLHAPATTTTTSKCNYHVVFEEGAKKEITKSERLSFIMHQAPHAPIGSYLNLDPPHLLPAAPAVSLLKLLRNTNRIRQVGTVFSRTFQKDNYFCQTTAEKPRNPHKEIYI